jgi:hypothetical protein
MSWVRIDDKAWSHPKLAGLSGNAVRLWLFALCWCNQQESDGHVPATMLRVLGASPKVAAELVAAGLWEVVEDGWQFHDYLNYQPSREQLASQRNATKERVTKYRERSRNGVTPTIGNAPVTPPPNPTQPNQITLRVMGESRASRLRDLERPAGAVSRQVGSRTKATRRLLRSCALTWLPSSGSSATTSSATRSPTPTRRSGRGSDVQASTARRGR